MAERGMGRVFRPMYKNKNGEWKRAAIWWIAYYHNGHEERESSGSRKRNTARRLLRDRLAASTIGTLVTGQAQRLRFVDLAERLYQDYRHNGRRSLDRVHRGVAHLDRFFTEFRASEVNDEAIERYVNQRLDQDGVAQASVKYELALLKRMFTLCRKFLPVRPSFPVLHLNNVRKGFFEEPEFRTFLANLDEDLQPVMEFAYLTGWRIKSEVLPLRWGLNVDMAAGEVRLEPGSTKNDEGRVFPFSILPELTELLTRQRRRTQAIEKATGRFVPWVFHRGGNRIKDFRGAWDKALKAAGITRKIPHDFRRTAVRGLERAGVPRSVAMKLVGHKTESIYQRYAIVARRDLMHGLQRLAEYRAGLKTEQDNPLSAEVAGGSK
ncbi:MAG TPA: tyrosine-type recombinase/integrase [Acidobacteriota bacterium]|nr:tyrosine-type recombinase/integrase [Acidobacteriota bacterium]